MEASASKTARKPDYSETSRKDQPDHSVTSDQRKIDKQWKQKRITTREKRRVKMELSPAYWRSPMPALHLSMSTVRQITDRVGGPCSI